LRSFNEELARLIKRSEKAYAESMQTCANTRRIIKECMVQVERFRAVDVNFIGFLRDMKSITRDSR